MAIIWTIVKMQKSFGIVMDTIIAVYTYGIAVTLIIIMIILVVIVIIDAENSHKLYHMHHKQEYKTKKNNRINISGSNSNVNSYKANKIFWDTIIVILGTYTRGTATTLIK